MPFFMFSGIFSSATSHRLAQCGPTISPQEHVACHSVISGPRRRLRKIFKSEICWKACEVTFV